MEVQNVPQEGNCTLGTHRKALYARKTDGEIIIVASSGSEVDETVTVQAITRMENMAELAKARVLAGETSPLEYWMYTCRMDVALLSQTSGIWAWRIRRHFNPDRFNRLPEKLLKRYEAALGIPVARLKQLP